MTCVLFLLEYFLEKWGNRKHMYYFLVNPASRSGQGIRDWERIRAVLEERKVPYQVRFSAKAGDMAHFAEEASVDAAKEDSCVHLVVLGGDGAVNEALQGIRNPDRIRFSNIPTGSGNDLARDIGISRRPLKALVHLLDSPKERRMDMGILHYHTAFLPEGKTFRKVSLPDRRFLVSSGIGFDAAVCQQAMASPFKNVLNRLGLGKLTYLGIALKLLARPGRAQARLWLDGNEDAPRKVSLNRLLFIACMSHCYEGGGFYFCPYADDGDGILDLCTVDNVPVWKILLVLPTAFFGKHYRYHGVERHAAGKIRIRTSRPLWVHTDGEVAAMSDDISIRCCRKFLAFYF